MTRFPVGRFRKKGLQWTRKGNKADASFSEEWSGPRERKLWTVLWGWREGSWHRCAISERLSAIHSGTKASELDLMFWGPLCCADGLSFAEATGYPKLYSPQIRLFCLRARSGLENGEQTTSNPELEKAFPCIRWMMERKVNFCLNIMRNDLSMRYRQD